MEILMILKFLSISILLFLIFPYAFSAPSRSPAVEPFVEVEITKETKFESQDLKITAYNLDPSVNSTIGQTNSSSISRETSFWAASLALILILSLPLISWLVVMNKFREKAKQESAENIAVLAKYKEEKENLKNSIGIDENKKAS